MLNADRSGRRTACCLPLLPILRRHTGASRSTTGMFSRRGSLPGVRRLSTRRPFGLPASTQMLFSRTKCGLLCGRLRKSCCTLTLEGVSTGAGSRRRQSMPFVFIVANGAGSSIRILGVLTACFTYGVGNIRTVLSGCLFVSVSMGNLGFRLTGFGS